jgi:O-antigen/teichoic acid export membrane protein
LIQHSRTKNYIRGLASGYVVTFATIIVGLWLTPFTLRFLDREQFAVFTLAADTLMWLGLLELGFTSVLNVRAAQITGKPDQSELNTLASTTFFAQLFVATTILIVGLIVSFIFPDFFALRGDLRQDAVSLMALMTLGSAISVGTQTFSALLVAHQQIHIDNLLRLGLIFIRTGLTVWLLIAGYGLLSLAWANLAATAITSLLAVYRVRKYLPGLSIHRRHFCWDILRQTGGTGIWFSLGGLAGILILNLDRIVTAKIISVEMVTTLSLTGRIYTLAWSLIQQLTNTARPALAQIIGQGKMDHALARYHQLVGLSTGLAIIVAASLWAGNGAYVSWWVGSQNYGGATLDALLAINLIVHCWVLPNRAILVSALSSIPQNNICRITEGFLNLSLSIFLGYVWGIKGIIISTAIAGLLTSCWYFPKLTANLFDLKLSWLLKKELPRLLGLTFVSALAACVGRTVSYQFTGIFSAIISSSICLSICVPVFWLFVLNPSIRQSVIEQISLRFSKKVS